MENDFHDLVDTILIVGRRHTGSVCDRLMAKGVKFIGFVLQSTRNEQIFREIKAIFARHPRDLNPLARERELLVCVDLHTVDLVVQSS